MLLIGIDTLRADRVGCYGYTRPTTPHLDALAQESVLFEQAIAQAPWTLPSFASIFTGLLPSTHGAGRGKGWTCDHLKPGRPTLATVFRAQGYRTASFVTNGWVSADAGMTEGVDPADAALHADSGATTTAALEWLRANGAQPFFMFLHVVDPHAPYLPPPEDLAALGDRIDAKARDRINEVAMTQRPVTDLLTTDRPVLSALYDAGVHQADRHIGEIVAALRATDLLDRTIVVVVSDHGEELLDHRQTGHGHSLFDEILHVPLLVRFPHGRWARRIQEQVRTMDLFPTLLDATDTPLPPGLDSESLLPLLGERPLRGPTPAAPSEFLWNGYERKSMRQPDAKMILTPATGELAWYDLAMDPGETRPIPGAHGKGVTLAQEIERVFARRLDGGMVSAFGDGEAHDLRLVLDADTRFDEAAMDGAERGDHIVLSTDRRRLKVRSHLDASMYVVEWVDIDTVRFRTQDDAPVRLHGRLDDAPLPASAVHVGQARSLPSGMSPWTFALDDPALAVPIGFRAVRAPRVAIAVTARGTTRKPPAPLSPAMQQNLRALGYVK